MIFDLRSLGWKAFQDLSAAVASEVLGRPVQTFLPSKDGGRDGAFVGTWEGAPDTCEAKSTIQCKFIGEVNARLTLAQLKSERSKVARLASAGLAHDYIVITNAGVSAEAEKAICEAFVSEGAKVCRVFDGGWIVNQLKERNRLRMMVPRVYGIGDLSQILAANAYEQAKYILSAMGNDLECFVTTESHRKAVSALNDAGFVLLLGDPASGKSTIAATLAMAALDSGCTGAVRISSPDQLDLWNPQEKQFLWVDDAFGSNQLDTLRVNGWNAELPRLRAAVRAGTKVVFTSRNYIWASAQRLLRISHFPLFAKSQVVINVQGLTETERAQILYNHIKYGDQPKEIRKVLKPFLPEVAASPAFLPEPARRIGNPLFVSDSNLTRSRIIDLVERPLDFLKEVINELDHASQAAIGLVFLSPIVGVPSPIAASEPLETVSRLHGVNAAQIARALHDLNGSITMLLDHPEGPRWTFRHPTINDAFATLVAESTELVELYVRGAKLERLVVEVTCGTKYTQGAKVHVPLSLYSTLIDRISCVEFDYRMMNFLTFRSDAIFLKQFLEARQIIDDLTSRIGSDLATNIELKFLARLKSDDILPETVRLEAIEKIREVTLDWLDTSIFADDMVRSLLTTIEFDKLEAEFQAEWLDDIDLTLSRWKSEFSVSDERSHVEGLKENLDRAENHFHKYVKLTASFRQAKRKIDLWLSELDEDEVTIPQVRKVPAVASAPAVVSIFDDIDD